MIAGGQVKYDQPSVTAVNERVDGRKLSVHEQPFTLSLQPLTASGRESPAESTKRGMKMCNDQADDLSQRDRLREGSPITGGLVLARATSTTRRLANEKQICSSTTADVANSAILSGLMSRRQ